MTDSKLFATANGRLFRVQATDRRTGKNVIMASYLTQRQCEAYQPSGLDKKLYVNFRVAFNDSKS